jgi:TPR repeat protein|tara:strand:+ start:79 stop:1998 length:1920 start_codon:yes stop_codon:yes gene_type:complete
MTELALKDIQAAVATTIIDEAQGARIITLAQNRRRFCHSITEKDEPFEMFRGFSEIHITVGLVILFLGIILIQESKTSLILTTGILSWLFSIYFTLKRRMKLPSMALAVIFAGSFMYLCIGYLFNDDGLIAASDLLITGLCGMLGMGIYFYTFRLPFAIFILGLFGFMAIMSASLMIEGGKIDNPSFDVLFALHKNSIFAYSSLLFGVLAFACGIYFDIKDPYRLSRFSQTGFWMHVLAAPLIVNTLLTTAYSLGGNTGYFLSFFVLGIIALVSLIIDRRSFLTAGLGYLTLIVWWAVGHIAPEMKFVITMIALGAIVTALGSWWGKLRSLTMRTLPDFPFKDRLPPYNQKLEAENRVKEKGRKQPHSKKTKLTTALIFAAAGFFLISFSPSHSADLKAAQDAVSRHDFATAHKITRPLAVRGNAIAQYNLGLMYASGDGVTQDYNEAVKWYRLAAEQGHSKAQNNLGGIYRHGEGVPKDIKEAVKWYRLSAGQGHSSAQANLGSIYENGEGGVPQDYKEAIKLYRLAAEQGMVLVQAKLGEIYIEGKLVPKNYKESAKWYRPAAEQGHRNAQFNLGLMYAEGKGVPQDYNEAVKWFVLAAEQGDAKAQELLDLISKEINMKRTERIARVPRILSHETI